MSRRQHTVTVLNPDGSTAAASHWDTPEEALEQFSAALRLAGHVEQRVQHHLKAWTRAQWRDALGYEALNPDLQGSVRINTSPD